MNNVLNFGFAYGVIFIRSWANEFVQKNPGTTSEFGKPVV
jgi:hypothetical protein